MMKLLVAFLLPFITSIYGQDSTYRIHFNKTQTVAGVPGGTVLGQTECDNNGNVYYRQYVGAKLTQAPVIKLTSDGTKSLVFDFNAVVGKDDIQAVQVRDFALHNSKVEILATTIGPKSQSKTRILTFSADDGTLKGIVTLETDITAARLGIMPSGEFFIFGVRTTGLQDSTDPSSFVHTAVKQMFSSSGKLIADLKIDQKEADLNSKKASPDENLHYVDLALVGSDQSNLYLLTYSDKPVLFLLGPDATVTKRLLLEPAEVGMKPLSLRVNGTEVLVEYTKPNDENARSEFVTYSTETGERLRTYLLAEDSNGVFGCYNSNGDFTFISSNKNQRTIKFGSAR